MESVLPYMRHYAGYGTTTSETYDGRRSTYVRNYTGYKATPTENYDGKSYTLHKELFRIWGNNKLKTMMERVPS